MIAWTHEFAIFVSVRTTPPCFLNLLKYIFTCWFRGIGRGGLTGSDEPPFKPGLFKNSIDADDLTKYNSLHRSNTVKNPRSHIVLISNCQ